MNAKAAGVFIAFILSERTENLNKIAFKIACVNESSVGLKGAVTLLAIFFKKATRVFALTEFQK